MTGAAAAGSARLSLDEQTVAVLRSWRLRQAEERLAWGEAWTDTGLVFTREDGSGYRPDHVTDLFARLVKEAGLPKVRLHDLRHSAASIALSHGVPLTIISRRLGPSPPALPA